MAITLQDVNRNLFDIMDRLCNPDEERPMDKDTALTCVKVAETLIHAGRAETEFIRAMNEMHPGGYREGEEPRATLFLGGGR